MGGGSNDWASTASSYNSWKTANCNGNGSDVAAPSAGTWTLAARGTLDNSIGIALTTFTYNPTTNNSTPQTTQPPVSYSSSGGSVSTAQLALLLAPGPATDAYLRSRGLAQVGSNPAVSNCPAGYACTPSANTPLSASNKPILISTTSLTSSFTRDLKIGYVGLDVKSLQQYLNSHGFTISAIGAGSPGHETTLFGGLTQKALQKFQKANGIPSTGFFGPITRGFVGK